MPDLSLVLHGRLGSWLVSATELPGAQRNLSSYRDRHAAKAALKYEQSSRLAAIRAFAAFTHRSLWEHVVLPNRRAGARVRVVMHSWSPEAGDVLDALYEPAASRHEPPPAIDKVSSQHTSMARACASAGLRGTPDDLVMVARLDLLLYRDVPLAELARTRSSSAPPKDIATTEASVAAAATAAVGPGDAIYLPHSCVPSRMRLPPGQGEAETRVLRRTCSGGSGKERYHRPAHAARATDALRPGAVRSLNLRPTSLPSSSTTSSSVARRLHTPLALWLPRILCGGARRPNSGHRRASPRSPAASGGDSAARSSPRGPTCTGPSTLRTRWSPQAFGCASCWCTRWTSRSRASGGSDATALLLFAGPGRAAPPSMAIFPTGKQAFRVLVR